MRHFISHLLKIKYIYMKISIIIVEGAKQIMLTPETDHEKEALKFINTDDKLEVVSKRGNFASEYNSHANLRVEECKGNFLRAFSDKESIMFLIKDKNK